MPAINQNYNSEKHEAQTSVEWLFEGKFVDCQFLKSVLGPQSNFLQVLEKTLSLSDE